MIQENLRLFISETIIRIITFNYFVIKRIIKKHKKQIKVDSVLDLGCGTGVLASLFKKSTYLGVDLDPVLIIYARKRHKGYKFLVGDGTKINIRRKFSFILVVGVVHHLDDDQSKKFFEVIATHLKKGGEVLVIEAVPPLSKWNIPGILDRSLDRGTFIRDKTGYEKLARRKFRIEESYYQHGGIPDYCVLVLSKR